MAHCKW